MPKGEERFRFRTIEVPVSQENTLGVLHLRLTFFRVVAMKSRIVLPPAFKRDRQFSRRAVIAKEDLSQCGPSLLSRIPGVQNRGSTVHPFRHVDVAAGGQHDNSVLVDCANLPDQFVLTSRKLKGPIRAFALRFRIEPDTNNYGIRLCGNRLGCTADERIGSSHAETCDRTTDCFEIFKADLVGVSGLQMPGIAINRLGMRLPVVNYGLAAEIQPYSIIG